MSTKIGLSPFHSNAWLVATKEYGVVITSPVTRNACSAVMSARVALAKSTMCFTPRYSHRASSNAWCMSPPLVRKRLSQIFSR